MTDILAHVEKSICSRQLLVRGQVVMVAVSGGVDSMVLLHLLKSFATKHQWKLFVAHFNHQLRGRSSDADEQLVRKTAAALGLKIFVGSGDVKAIAKKRKQSIEMAARELRHEFLARTAQKLKCRIIALAHHADDQVELFFLRLLRGAGAEGLAGMKWQNPSPVKSTIRLIRPLLDLQKDELVEFAREKKISFREDASNASLDMRRNRIRQELLPYLRREFGARPEKTIPRVMEIVGAEADLIARMARNWLKLKRSSFSGLSIALQRQVLQMQLQRQAIACDFELIESLRLDVGRQYMITPNQTVARDATGCLMVREVPRSKFSNRQFIVNLEGGAGEGTFAGVQIRWRVVSQQGSQRPSQAAGHEVFDADLVGPNVVLRHWRPGDRYQPIGMPKSVKLQDWFTNRKITQSQRHDLIVATTASGEIFWVEGQRISERFKLTPGTRRRLMWGWRRG